MNRSTPGLPVYHQLPEFTQTHVHRVGDAIQPTIGVAVSASVLPMNTQDRSPSKLWLLEITLMSLVSYHVALLLLCTGQTVAYMNKVMNWSDPATVSKAMAT